MSDVIVLRQIKGELELLAHRPAPVRKPWRQRFPDLSTHFAPYTWPTLCEAGDGIVYHRGGPLADIADCDACTLIEAA